MTANTSKLGMTDSQWILDVMGRYDFTMPQAAFDEIVRKLAARQPAAIDKEAATLTDDARNLVTLDRRDLWDYVRGAIHAALNDKIPKNCVVSWAWEEATNRTMDIFQAIVDATPLANEASKPACAHRIVDARNEIVKSGYLCVDCGAVFAGIHAPAAPSVEQDERVAFEAWAKGKYSTRYIGTYMDRDADAYERTKLAEAALDGWQARAALTSSGRCFFCGEPMDGAHEQDCPQANDSANVAQGAEAVGWFMQRSKFGPWVEVEQQEPGAEQFYRGAPPAQTALTDAQWLELRRIARTYNETGFPKHAREFFAALTAAQSASGDAK